ncbi:MAG: DUF2779 domain-containing protein [Anaerolineae bacterium]|jgi:hypothetical protein|nr:DUF2779 domain-containing protein [Anaerolineae bacterium]MBT7323563.1 DUF2779 domain-containing protein [Anaerolineae bacterium]
MDKDLTITKSDYKIFLDAPIHLWGEKHGHRNKKLTAFEGHITDQGYKVEELANSYLEKHIVNADVGESVQFQQEFSDRQFLARTDALVFKPKTNTYDLYEIKSSSRNKPEFTLDAAFQYLIANKHIKIDRIYILHLNSGYVRHSSLDIEKLFIAEDISDAVQDCLIEVETNREEASKVAISNSPEGIQHCYKPKDCPCPDLCHPDLPKYSIYNIPRISEKKKILLLNQGVREIEKIPADFALNEKQQKIVRVIKAKKAHIDREAIRQKFETFTYPLYFLDYETFLATIPLFDGFHPQQQMVFQYSLHRKDTLPDECVHTECLSITQENPTTPLLRQLSEDIGRTGTVFVWNKTFEISRNKEMAGLHPEYADMLKNLNDRIYDLGDFINKGLYVHPDFLGSWSIKKVLPVMVPELSYTGMDISKGDQAMVAWQKIINAELPAHEVEKTKRALLEYCQLDTYAMVAILMKLAEFLS